MWIAASRNVLNKFWIKSLLLFWLYHLISREPGFCLTLTESRSNDPAGNYMFKFNNRHARTRSEICLKLTIKTPEWRHWRRTHNHLVQKRTLNHFTKLAKWLSCVVSTYLHGAFDCIFLSCHVRVSEWIHTLSLPECQGNPCSKQARNRIIIMLLKKLIVPGRWKKNWFFIYFFVTHCQEFTYKTNKVYEFILFNCSHFTRLS